MNKDQISPQQFMILFWGSLLAPLAEGLARVTLPYTGKASYLAPLLALPVLLLVGGMVWRLSKQRNPNQTPHPMMIFLGYLYGVWGVCLIGVRLRLCAERLVNTGYRDGSLWLLIPVIALFVGWLSCGSLPSFARTATMFFAGITVLLGVILLLSVDEVRAVNVLPLWTQHNDGMASSVVGLVGIFGYGIFATLFLPKVAWTKPNQPKTIWVTWGVTMCVVLSVILCVTIGHFGATLALQLNQPFFQLAKGVSVRGGFQRIESVASAVWSLADFILLGVLVRSVCACVPQISPRIVISVVMVVATVIASGVTTRVAEGVVWVNLLFAVGLPLCVGGMALAKKQIKKP